MDSFEQLSRRGFLGRTLKLGATGLAASCISASRSIAKEGFSSDGPWQIGCYTQGAAVFKYQVHHCISLHRFSYWLE